MIEWLNGLITELIGLVRAAAVLVAVASVGYAYARTRSLVTLLLAALTAGIFLWAINNTDWWQARVGEETETGVGRPAAVVASAGPAGGPGPVAGPVVIGGWGG